MKRILSIFAVKSVLMTVIVGAIALGVWYVHFAVEELLSSPHTFGDVTITPYGHHQNNLFDQYYDSILVQKGQSSYMIRKPHLDITILGENRGVVLDVGEVDINQVADTTSGDSSSTVEPFELPDRIQFPIPVKVSVGKFAFKMNDMGWGAQNILVQSTGKQSIAVSADSISGSYIKDPASLKLAIDIEKENLSLRGRVQTENDNVAIIAYAPRKDLTQAKVTTSINVKDPLAWVPMELSKSIPAIKNLDLNGSVSTSFSKKTLQYNFTLKTHIGEFYPFLPLDATIKVSGNTKQTKISTKFDNNEGGWITLGGSLDNTNLDFDISGEISHMSAMFGPQMMPMDVEIHSLKKTGDNIEADIETREGSIINATVNTAENMKVDFTANLSPMEPWVLDWVKGNVELGRNAKLFGSFENGKLRAYVKIDSIINAYHMKADSLRLSLILDGNGIIFPRGAIYTANEDYTLSGDVDWHEPTLHTSWQIKQKHGGSAEATVHVGDSLIVWARADHAEISTVPFSDIELNDKLKGTITGTWRHNLDSRVGEARLDIDGNVEPFLLHSYVKVREVEDTIFVDTAYAFHNSNKVAMQGIFVMQNDSNPNFKPTAMLPIQVLHASASAEDFNIPLLLEPLGDTTLASGRFNGAISYEEESGLLGNIEFNDLNFKNIPSELFNIRQLNVSAKEKKVELLANFDIANGIWTGDANIVVDNIFDPDRLVQLTYESANGGSIIGSGTLNNQFELLGSIDIGGSWLIPGVRAEILKTDMNIQVEGSLNDGLHGISAKLKSDSTIVKYSTIANHFPFHISGELKDGLLEMNEIYTKNEFGEILLAKLKYDLQTMKLEAIDIGTPKYTLKTNRHKIVVRNVTSHLEDTEEQMSLTAKIPLVKYTFKDETFGNANLSGKSDITFSIPHTQEGQIKNNSISGNFIIDKFVYRKDLDIEITPSSLDKIISLFNNAITSLRNKEKTEAKISVSSPIDLAFHVSDSQSDSVDIITPFATFPFTLDIWILGTTNRPLLRGDVTNANSGFIGIKSIYEFDLNTFSISWNDVPWQHGIIDVSSSQELPYCTETDDNEKETCPINFDIQGTITNPQPNPNSNCGTESTAAATYYNIFLGCIATESGESTDWNKLAGKAIGKVISSTANKTLGGDYIGDIDMKVKLFNNSSNNEKDSTYFKIPISLNRWVKNLSLIFGYTQDQSENPTYEQALQFGATYTLPVFQDKEYSHKNHLNPSLSLNGLLISKQYLSNTGTASNENRIEKNIGINYTYKFWNPCLLGIGHCETVRPPRAMRQPNDPTLNDSQKTNGPEKAK